MRVVCLSEPKAIIRIFTPNVRMLNLLEEMKLCQQTDKNKYAQLYKELYEIEKKCNYCYDESPTYKTLF
jgi:hypothetical protein|nr:MAG TPA: hypothetical protein [Caudoviricetes sp.]